MLLYCARVTTCESRRSCDHLPPLVAAVKMNHNVRTLHAESERQKLIQTNPESCESVISDLVVQIRNAVWIEEYFTKVESLGKEGLKSAETAREWREQGNRLFKRKENKKALECYNKCILHAPPSTTDLQLALGFANRSAVLYHLHEYESCLGDIDRALVHGYPQDLQHKLYQRQGHCNLQLRQYPQAQTALNKALDLIQESHTLQDNKKVTMQREVQVMLQTVENSVAVESQQHETVIQETANDLTIPEISYGMNTVIVQATKVIDLKHNDKQGRFLIANQPIKIGDTLIVERPFAAVLLPSHYETHCHHCFGSVLIPLPCHQCAQVRYCSDECRQLSWKVYHYIECPYLDLLHLIGIAHLSLRVVLTAGLKYLLEFRETVAALPSVPSERLPGVTPEGRYERNYLTVHELMTHAEDMETCDLFQYSVTGALLLKCLEHSCFFHESSITMQQDNALDKGHSTIGSSEVKAHCACDTSKGPTVKRDPASEDSCKKRNLQRDSWTSFVSEKSHADSQSHTRTEKSRHLSDMSHEASQGLSQLKLRCDECGTDPVISHNDKLYIGSLLLRHILQLVCNAHAITELQVSQSSDSSLVDTKSQVRVATAIYPTTSLMNHSCDPSIIASFHRDTLVVRAVKDIPVGGEIFNCYGPHHKRMSVAERQQSLQDQYFFQCQCQACHSDTQTQDMLQALKCPACSGPLSRPKPEMTCFNCGHSTPGLDLMQTVLSAHDIFINGVTLLEKQDISGALGELLKCLEMRRKVMYRHHRDLAQAHDAVARCYATLGDYNKCAEQLKESISTAEVIYGEKSIECGNELHKYAEVLFNGRKVQEALQVIDRALDIFQLHYGNYHQSCQELLQMKACLMDFTDQT